MNLLWGECTWEDIAEAAKAGYIVVLPAGAIEQHGPMLPVDVDARLAERWAVDGARRAREKYGVDVLVLPPLPYGQSCHHMKFAGTISLGFETYIAALSDIMRAVLDWGFRSIVVINGNGGNETSIQVARYKLLEEMTRQGREARIYLHDGFADPHARAEWEKLYGSPPLSEERMGIHAASAETAEMLADRPHLVKREKMVKAQLKRDTVPLFAWRTDELSVTGAFGDPGLATAELGEKLWEAWTESIARFLAAVRDEQQAGGR